MKRVEVESYRRKEEGWRKRKEGSRGRRRIKGRTEASSGGKQ